MPGLFADAGVPPALIPITGGLCVAGLFLAAAAVFGGLWLAKGSPAARRRFFLALALGCLLAAVPMAYLGSTGSLDSGIAAAVLAVIGTVAVRKLRTSPPAPPPPPDDPMN